MGALTRPLQMAGGGATCMRSTCGCGSFAVGGRVWGVCQTLSVTETEERRETVQKDCAKRSHETRRRREAVKHGDD